LSDGQPWQLGAIGSLNIEASDSMFIRSCVAGDATTYKYPQSPAILYLYVQRPGGRLERYGLQANKAASGEVWTLDSNLPPINLDDEIECQIAGGFDALWTVNSAKNLEQWWRGTTGDWVKGKSTTDLEICLQQHPNLTECRI
jgi:hypothetical protein